MSITNNYVCYFKRRSKQEMVKQNGQTTALIATVQSMYYTTLGTLKQKETSQLLRPPAWHVASARRLRPSRRRRSRRAWVTSSCACRRRLTSSDRWGRRGRCPAATPSASDCACPVYHNKHHHIATCTTVSHMLAPHASYSIMHSYKSRHIQSQFSLKLTFAKFTVVACSSKHCRCNSRRLLLAILLTDSVKYRTPVGRKQNRNRIYLCYM